MIQYVVDTYQNQYSIRLHDLSQLPFECPRGSYNVFQARLFNMSYVEYLKYIRATYGAKLIGRDSLYISVYFTSKDKALAHCKELNHRLILAREAHAELFN